MPGKYGKSGGIIVAAGCNIVKERIPLYVVSGCGNKCEQWYDAQLETMIMK